MEPSGLLEKGPLSFAQWLHKHKEVQSPNKPAGQPLPTARLGHGASSAKGP